MFGSIRLGLGLLRAREGCAQEHLALKGKGMPTERCSRDKLTQPGQASVTRVYGAGQGGEHDFLVIDAGTHPLFYVHCGPSAWQDQDKLS